MAGVCALLVSVALNCVTSILLVRVAEGERVTTYDAAIRQLLGLRWLRLYQTLMVLSTLGSLAACIILVGYLTHTQHRHRLYTHLPPTRE